MFFNDIIDSQEIDKKIEIFPFVPIDDLRRVFCIGIEL